MGLFNKLLGNASEVSLAKLNEKYGRLLVESEVIELGFKLLRDTFVFTNKRLILIDVQGLTVRLNINRFPIRTSPGFPLNPPLGLLIWTPN